MSPGCQKILSTSITGSPVISPKRLARVDLPDAPRPMMTTRFILPSLRKFQSGTTVADCHALGIVQPLPSKAVEFNVARRHAPRAGHLLHC